MKWKTLLVAISCALIILFGLGFTLQQDVLVARFPGDAGRLHPHLKNVTRFPGDAVAVHRAVHRAVFLEEPTTGPPGDWRQRIRDGTGQSTKPGHVVVLPADDLAWALPGAYFAAWAGSPVVFAGEQGLDAEGLALVRRLALPAVIAAPERLVSDAVEQSLAEIGPTERVAADSLADHAVRIAEHRDETGFGWGRDHDQRDGYFHFVVSTPSEAAVALEGLPLATENAATLLYAADDGGIPAATDRYLWAQRTDWFVTPSEGPFRHIFVLGDRTSLAGQARADLALEKSPYVSMGELALGPMEALAIAFIALGLGTGLFVLVHALRFLPHVPLGHRLAWAMGASLLPVLGLFVYSAAWRRPRREDGPGEVPRYLRPPAVQAAAATLMGFGYGAPIMIVVGWLFAWYGLPIIPDAPWPPVLGSGMVLMMVGMYVLAVLIAWPMVQMPMRAMMHPEADKKHVAKVSLGVTALSMAMVSLGMMTVSWLMMMQQIPMMPKEDDILWFGSLWLASFVGFLVAWPLNAPLVRHRLKPGSA